jgi:hypothetical protein
VLRQRRDLPRVTGCLYPSISSGRLAICRALTSHPGPRSCQVKRHERPRLAPRPPRPPPLLRGLRSPLPASLKLRAATSVCQAFHAAASSSPEIASTFKVSVRLLTMPSSSPRGKVKRPVTGSPVARHLTACSFASKRIRPVGLVAYSMRKCWQFVASRCACPLVQRLPAAYLEWINPWSQ